MIISLLTDFGLNDNFVGVIKAIILNINPKAIIIDITHNIIPQDIRQAAFILKYSYKFFPRSTIHLVVVDPTVGSKRENILAKTDNYYFIGPDNGVLSLALDNERIKKFIQINNDKYFLKPVSDTFQARDIFAPTAAYLSKGTPIDNFGKKIKRLNTIRLPEVKITKDSLIGEVIYIDNFGNLITNIDKELFKRFIKERDFIIKIKDKIIKNISHSYSEVKANTALAIFDSFDSLEISINQGNASKLLNSKISTRITVKK